MPVTEEHIETAKAVARRYGATRMVVFGSAVDDPEHARDLDLAIEGGDLRARGGREETHLVLDYLREQVERFLAELEARDE